MTDVANMTHEELVAAFLAEKEKNKQEAKKKVVIKVSQKGCVQINGIRRFPVTFYKNEWETILGMADEIRSFIEDNKEQLASK